MALRAPWRGGIAACIVGRMRTATILAALLALLPAGAAAQALRPGPGTVELRHGGFARVYATYVPGPPADARPLVLILHGAGGEARQTLENYRWDRAADRAGFVVAAPQGLPARPRSRPNLLLNPNVWNDGSDRFSAERRAIDDVAFLAAVLDDVARRVAIDRRRIYIAGMSNGASMTFHAASRMPERFAAAAAVSGHFWDPPSRIAPALSLLFIVGDSDPLNPIEGGMARNPWGRPSAKPPMIRSAEAWARAIGCSDGPGASRDLPPSLIVWAQCPDEARVTMRTVRGMGHVWPGAVRELPERLVGPRVRGMDATADIWAFFAQHRRP